MSRIHVPVEGYEEHLSRRVNNFFDRLGDEPVWRRNWFIHPDNSLYQPQRPLNGDPIIKFGQIDEKLFVRSERQTLQALGHTWVDFIHDPCSENSSQKFIKQAQRRVSKVDF